MKSSDEDAAIVNPILSSIQSIARDWKKSHGVQSTAAIRVRNRLGREQCPIRVDFCRRLVVAGFS